MKKYYWVGGFVAIILVVGLGFIVFASNGDDEKTENDTASREYRIVIPAGTGEQIANGEDPDIIPQEVDLKLGEKDILVIENHDTVTHAVALFAVGPGETIRQEFTEAKVYEGQCTIHPDSQVKLTVHDSE